MASSVKPNNKRIFTIPNILSVTRIALIPVIVWLYHVKKWNLWAAFVLVLSGVTDVADGIIARKFHMVSDMGKILDPIADKLTQAAVLGCLVFRFPLMGIPLVVMLLKETVDAIWGLIIIHKTGQVTGAQWHGKAATVLLYALMFLHFAWEAIPNFFSFVSIAICTAMMFLSFILYCIRNWKQQKMSLQHL